MKPRLVASALALGLAAGCWHDGGQSTTFTRGDKAFVALLITGLVVGIAVVVLANDCQHGDGFC